jgi:hypothetical protein
MRFWSREPDVEPQIESILILGTLNPAERRDLAKALLRAAWSASREVTRDLPTATDPAAIWRARG